MSRPVKSRKKSRTRSCSACRRAACVSFRALVSSPRFLRRHRTLHPDPGVLLGVFTFSLCEYGADGGAAIHPAEPPLPLSCPIHAIWNRRHYAHGRFYWVDCLTNRWLVLDTSAMEISVAEIPSPVSYWEEHVAVVEAPGGKVGVFAHDFYHVGGKANVCYYTIEHDGGAPRRQLEKTIVLPWPADNGRPFCIQGTANGCLIIEISEGTPAFMSSHGTRDVELFKIDVKSFQVQRVWRARCAGGTAGEYCWPYFGFPPSLSLPTV